MTAPAGRRPQLLLMKIIFSKLPCLVGRNRKGVDDRPECPDQWPSDRELCGESRESRSLDS